MKVLRFLAGVAVYMLIAVGMFSTAAAGGTSITIMGGVSISNQQFHYYWGDPPWNRDSYTSETFAIGVGLPLIAGLEWAPEVAYVDKGSERTSSWTDEFNRTLVFYETYRVEYVSVRVPVRWYPPVLGRKPYVYAGMRLDVETGVRSTQQVTPPLGGTPGIDPLLNGPESVVPGGIVGLGCELGISPALRIVLQGAYDFDLSKSWHDLDPQPKVGDLDSMKNHAVEILAGVKFAI